MVAFAIVLLFIPAMISAAALPEMVRYVRLVETLGNPVVYVGPVGWLSGCAAPRLAGWRAGPAVLGRFGRRR